MKLFVQYINALIILVLGGVLTGAYVVQVALDVLPCSLCILQRAAMVGVTMGEILNLRYGVQSSHYSLSYFSALFGAAVSLKQFSLHYCPGTSDYPVTVWGLKLYTWALIVFISVMLAISILHFLDPLPKKEREVHQVTLIGWIAMGFIMVITFCNIVI